MPKERKYHFGQFEVDLDRACLTSGGEERHLRQKAFLVLVYLLEHRERLVSKEELFELIWKDTAVTDDTLVQAVKEIRRAIGDDPHRPLYIKTVPRSGYRFIAEVTTAVDGGAAPGVSKTRPNSRKLYLGAAAVIGVCLLLAGLAFRWPAGLFAGSAARRTIAVLAFENRSDDPRTDWLREGIADMLMAGMSRSDKLAPIDRGQISTLVERITGTGAKPDPTEIARQAHAQIFVDGAFSQIGESVRLDVYIHDGQTGDLVGTESLAVEKAESLLTQIDLLSLRLLNRLNATAADSPQLASVMTDNLEAYRYYSLGVAKANALENAEAIELLQKAVELDPNFAMAHARIGYVYAVMWGLTDEGKPYLEKAFRLSTRMTERDRRNIAAWYAIANLDYPAAIDAYREIIRQYPLDTEAYWRLGRLLGGEERYDEAIDVLRQGIAVDPEYKNLFNSLGNVLSNQGRHADAIATHERYVALAPNEANAYDSLGLTYQWAGDYEKALQNFSRALEVNPQFDIALIHHAQCRIRMGQYRPAIEDARRYIASVRLLKEKGRGFDTLSYIYFLMGDMRSAEIAAAQNLAINPDYAWVAYLVAFSRGQTDKAKRLENNVLARPHFPERGSRGNARFGLYYRGMVALNNGRGEEALGYFREVITHRPVTWSYEDFEDCLGRGYLTLGRYDEAIAEFERVLQLSPNYPLARYHIAQAYRAKGMTAEARDNYRQFLVEWKDAAPDTAEIVEARQFVPSSAA